MPGTLEALLRHDRRLAVASFALILTLAWGWLVAHAGMEDGVPAEWSPGFALLMFVMWWIMMVAMMLPSAAPAILLAAALQRKVQPDRAPYAGVGLFAGGYVAAWTLFSVVATGAQWALEALGLLGPALRSSSSALTGALLLAAGLWQFTRFKSVCLRNCRAPVDVLTRHRRGGRLGGLRMGLEHGAFCIGCCWVLMALLFVGGVMDLRWIVGLTAYVLAEKVLPRGEAISRLAGVGLTLWGTWLLAGAP